MPEAITAHIIGLGCPKNLVDAECMATILLENHVQIVSDCEDAECIIVNTCGFIEPAKKEAIDTILRAADFKTSHKCRFLIVTGCLAERYREDILRDLPEVDAVLGTREYHYIYHAIHSLYQGSPVTCDFLSPLEHMRKHRAVSTKGYAWLKIAEGCSNRCAYCAIPMIRGSYVSRPMEDLLEEAAFLVSQGHHEIILAAQDITHYGVDIYGERRLPELLKLLTAIPDLRWLRLMYTYSDGMTDALIDEIATNDKIVKYIDMPIQHGDNDVLRSMRRRDTAESIVEGVERLRRKIPDIILRTTVLVGFPGETEEAFTHLLELLRKVEFDRLGAFPFSCEEGTDAADMPNPVDPELVTTRWQEVMELQQEISLKKNIARIGKSFNVALESISEDGVFYIGRSYGEAPGIDPEILVLSPNGPLEIGQVVPVRIVDASHYELTGESLI